MLQFAILIAIVFAGCVIVARVHRWAAEEPDTQLESIRDLGTIHDVGLLTDEEWQAVKRVLG
jgi:hypothetical protein